MPHIRRGARLRDVCWKRHCAAVGLAMAAVACVRFIDRDFILFDFCRRAFLSSSYFFIGKLVRFSLNGMNQECYEVLESEAPLADEESLSPVGSGSEAVGGPSFNDILQSQSDSSKAASRVWDPRNCSDWDPTPSRGCLHRIRRDLVSLYDDPPYGVFAVPDDDITTIIHAMIIGPYDTPYEGGFFYLLLRCPPDYPIRSPRVRMLTTGDGQVRFNPNLYSDGKVCLSILGTWSGPSWSPAQSLTSVLVSIQSLLGENPYHNEPGYDQEHEPGDSRRYNDIIAHETIRVAVCGSLEGIYGSDKNCPQALKDVMQRSFPQYYDHYVEVCHRLLPLQGKPMEDPFGEQRGRFDPKGLLERLEALKTKIESEMELESENEDEERTNTDE